MGKKGRGGWKIKKQKVKEPLRAVPEEMRTAKIYGCPTCAEDDIACYVYVGEYVNSVFENKAFLTCHNCGFKSTLYDIDTHETIWYCMHLKSQAKYMESLSIQIPWESWHPGVLVEVININQDDIIRMIEALRKDG